MDVELCPNCHEHRETECRCGWVEGDPLEDEE